MRKICHNCIWWEREARGRQNQYGATIKGRCRGGRPNPTGWFTPNFDDWCKEFEPERKLGIFPVDRHKRDFGFP